MNLQSMSYQVIKKKNNGTECLLTFICLYLFHTLFHISLPAVPVIVVKSLEILYHRDAPKLETLAEDINKDVERKFKACVAAVTDLQCVKEFFDLVEKPSKVLETCERFKVNMNDFRKLVDRAHKVHTRVRNKFISSGLSLYKPDNLDDVD
jgi:hypothetical protein